MRDVLRKSKRKSPPDLHPDPLTTKRQWDQRHHHILPQKTYPDPRIHFLDLELDKVFKKHLAGSAGKKLIEVGCGSSLWLPYFKKEFDLDIWGIDYSMRGIEICSKILEKNRVEGRLIQADIFEWAAGSQGRFHIVFSLGLIEHFRQPSQVLTLFNALLSPSGLCMTWVPNTSGLVTKLSILMNKNLKNYYTTLDLNRLEHEHRSAGFIIEESTYTQFLDFSLLNLLRLPKFWQRCFSKGFRLFTIPFRFLEKHLNLHISSKFLSSGIVIIARKAAEN